jgi:hypothetical protein
MAKYSEHILSTSSEANALLNAFGSGNNFTNSVILKAFTDYLGNYVTSDGIQAFNTNISMSSGLDATAVNTALQSQYYLPAVFSDQTKVSNLTTSNIPDPSTLLSEAQTQ